MPHGIHEKQQTLSLKRLEVGAMEFDDVWERQAEQQAKLGIDPSTMTGEERHRVLADLLLGLYEEVTELKRDLIPKFHQLKAEQDVPGNAVDQCVDAFKYVLAIAQAIGVTRKEFLQAFFEKSNLVDKRWHAELMDLKESTNVVVTDLDGVVADFFAQFDVFCQGQTGKGYVQLNQAQREAVAMKYYQDGMFRETGIIDGAPAALNRIKQAGFKLVVITARPYHRVRRIATDTYHWLGKHGINPDMILWSKDKSGAVWESVHPAKVVGFIEDDPKHALDLAQDGINVLYFKSPISDDLPDHDCLKPVVNWAEVLKAIGLE
jgi:hypothetical protein